MDISNLSTLWIVIIIAITLWELAWKGPALWKAAHNEHLAWFVIILIVNSAGLLPIIYLLMHQNKLKPSQKNAA